MYMQDTESRSYGIEVCEGIYKTLTPVRQVQNGRLLKEKLWDSLKKIRNTRENAEHFSDDTSLLSPPFLWLCDNFSFIEEEYIHTVNAVSKHKGLFCNTKMPLSYSMAKKLLYLTEGKLNEASVEALILAFDKCTPFGLSFDDREAFPVFIKCAVLNYLGDLSESLSGKDGVFGNKSHGDELINTIKTLKELAVMDHTECFSDTELEKTLKNDPSAAYPKMDERSKFELRLLLHLEAKRKKLSDTEYAKELLLKAKKDGKYIGSFLDTNPRYRRLFFPALYLFSASVAIYLSCITHPALFVFLFFPILDAAKPIFEAICAKMMRTCGSIPSLKLEEIPHNAKTLCVITALLRGEKYDSELFSKLERIYNANSTDNLRFGLLCDLSDSAYATNADDEKIISYASGRIDSLNAKYDNSFILFIRPRSYSKSEKCFMAYERKRGAVIELTRLIKTGTSSFDTNIKSLRENRDFLSDTKYVITLDADTNLGIDTAKELVGKMLHPMNTPVIDKKKHLVVSGYGIMQPKMSTELDGARKTPFSRLMCDSGGVDIYSGASFELYQSLFGEGIFCGKGIFDVNAFYETVSNSGIFPDDKILSHDILEGERLRTALLCDIELTDGFPKNELSYLKRKHRWIRGDIQNIPFLSKKYGYGMLSKYKLFDNVRRVITPIISLFLILSSLFLPMEFSAILFFTAFSPYIIPFIIDLINIVLKLAIKSAARKFFSKGVTVGLWQSFLRMLFFEAMLAKDGFMALGALITSVYRMCFTKRNLLEWVTAAQSDSGKTDAALFITKHIGSCVVGALLFIFSPSGLIKLSGLAFFAMPFVGYFTSKNADKKQKENEKNTARLKGYAADIWKFFEENVNEKECHLPPDNIQLAPYEKTAHRTSPTNIGLYLVSVLCARDLGLIDTKELYQRIENTLDTVKRLKKHNGHLYNWYDTQSLEVLSPKYISSVDSGNLIACLITLKSGIYDYTGEEPKLVETVKTVTELIDNTDIGFVFNKKRELFYVGAEISDKTVYDKSCYDLFMSESRILSYIATSSRAVPKTHFRRLSRPLITSGGYIGLSSWSGTAFEYFMPALFMPFKKGSLLYEAMLFAYKAQNARKIGKDKIWGISESAYFAFDCELNYQYRAFGVPILGRCTDNKDQAVISPYSSFLSLCVSKDGPCENLSKLEGLGMYGKYGFYEALDLTRSRVKGRRAIVKSYMSHHLGMSFLAITNAVNSESVIKRFMLDSKMSCGNELLEEKIPVNAVIKKLRKTASLPVSSDNHSAPEKAVSESFSYTDPLCSCLSDGKSTCIISDCGHVSFSKGDILFNRADFTKAFQDMPETFSCYIKADGKVVGMTPLSMLPDKTASFAFSYSECSATHSIFTDKGDFSLEYTVSSQKYSPIKLKLSKKSNAEDVRLCFSFAPCLTTEMAYRSHPAFSELFLEASFDDEEKILFFKRRPRSSNEEETVLALGFCDKTPSVFFSTRCFYGMQKKIVHDPFLLFDTSDGKTGACINPYCVFGTDISNSSEAQLIIVMTHSEKSAKEAIISERSHNFEKAKASLSEISTQFTLSSGISSLSSCKTVSEMLSSALFTKDTFRAKSLFAKELVFDSKKDISINSLWKHGISGDHPIISIDTGNYFFASPLEKRIRAFKLLTMKNVRLDLVIIYSETDRYERKNEKKLLDLLHSCGASGYLGRNKGGIHLINKTASHEDVRALRFVSASYDEIYSSNIPERKKNIYQKALLPVIVGNPCDIPKSGYKVKGGYFEIDHFVVDRTDAQKAPFAHVLSGENISTVLTENSLGYTFYKNASERRITPFAKNGNSSFYGEKLCLSINGVVFDLAECSSLVKYYSDKAQYHGKVASSSYVITVYCSYKLPSKIINAEIKGDSLNGAVLFFEVKPCMGRFPTKNAILRKDDSTVFFSNPMSEVFSEYRGFVKAFTKPENELFEYRDNRAKELSEQVCVGCTLKNGKNSCNFVLGVEKKNSDILGLVEKELSHNDDDSSTDEKEFCNSLIPKISFASSGGSDEQKSLEFMFNRYLAHSCVFSRFLSRSGYYQSGGAYGFRDQLQDCLMLMYSDKKRAFSHICRAASHQFKEGDVLHWWHTQGKKGVRTTCSDDYLWLVYVLCEYMKFSGDASLLDICVPYVEGAQLSEGENERYIAFSNSTSKETLYLHAARALDRALSKLGEHGLSIMGCCDWCDGYSSVGKNGKGESTFTTVFLIIDLLSFADICSKRNDKEREDRYKDYAQRLIDSLLKHCYDVKNGYFIRGYYDDMTPLGSALNDEGKIDLMAQCFSPMCFLDEAITKSSLDAAYESLFDKKYGIMKLLSPPFDKGEKNPGYIKGYLAGVRENGGQYTHGALFFALGCFELSDRLFDSDTEASEKYASMGGEILKYSNPAFRCSDSAPFEIRDAYITEPYAVAADIYSSKDHIGRGGWTHYTGASGWFYRLILNYVFGVRVFDADTERPYILINAKRSFPLSAITDGGALSFKEFGFDLKILYIRDGKKRVTSGGKVIEDGKIYKETKKIEVHI